MDEIETSQAHAMTVKQWAVEGLRSGFLLPPRVEGPPAPVHLITLVVLCTAIGLGLARLEVPGSASFNAIGWISPWWTFAVAVLLLWTLSSGVRPRDARPSPGVAGWMLLWIVGSVPVSLLGEALTILRAWELMPAALEESPVFAWGVWILMMTWSVAVPVVLGHRLGLPAARLAVLAAGMVAMTWVTATYSYYRPWYSDAPREDAAPRFAITQESFETQQAVWNKAVAALAPERAGVRDVYGLVFAPYADEDVFLREGTMVADVLAQRFDAQGRVLHLANHATTGDRLPWATPLNLQRAVEAIAQRMDREQDVLMVYLTSHGARNFQLSSRHWPLSMDNVSPSGLRRALDDAGVRHRVVAVSACYSGGWIGPLASDDTLVMTAADPDHTSYGCGRLSELTFFGRAVFNEQLRATRSFEAAFAAAVPLIRQREQEAGKSDGFSNPQISVGPRIRPVLQEIEKRLDAAPPT